MAVVCSQIHSSLVVKAEGPWTGQKQASDGLHWPHVLVINSPYGHWEQTGNVVETLLMEEPGDHLILFRLHAVTSVT